MVLDLGIEKRSVTVDARGWVRWSRTILGLGQGANGVWLALAVAFPALGQSPVNSRPFRIEELQTPPGYEVSIYARIPGSPRFLTFAPNGVLYAAGYGNGTVAAIAADGRVVTVLSGLRGPHSLAFQGGDLYVAVYDGVLLFRDALPEDLIVRSQPERIISLPSGGGHSSRTAGFGPDGRIYVTAGSSCNFCSETDPRRAAMMRYEADGSGQSILARGLRNSVGYAWHPITGELWATDNGGDGLGEDSPPDEINVIREGGDYGWPDCMGRRRPVNWGFQAQPGRCPDTLEPEFELQAHSAALGISFYTGTQFPASFQNDALVAFHGSWNRNEPTGFKVVRVHSSSGRATGVEDFLWGFLDTRTRTRSGRPVRALSGPDGAVYISDDATGNIYRVAYTGPRISPGGIVRAAPGIYELYGENLMRDPVQFSITANGEELETLYLSPNQVNFIVPEGLYGNVTITVKNERATDEAVISIE